MAAQVFEMSGTTMSEAKAIIGICKVSKPSIYLALLSN